MNYHKYTPVIYFRSVQIDFEMVLNTKIASVYDNIDFNNQYLKLKEDHNSDKYLEKVEKNRVLEIFEDLGYKAKHMKSENFYKVVESINNLEFYFHASLKYSVYQPNFGVIQKSPKKHLAGGVSAFDDYRVYKELDEIESKPASFSSYEELKEILEKALNLYEDFKIEFLKLEL